MHAKSFPRLLPSLLLLSLSSGSALADAPFEPPATAADLGLMQGFPPPPDQRVTRRNFMEAPANRWSFQHIRELQPTREIYRGTGAPSELVADPVALEELEIEISDGRRVSVSRWQQESHTDAMVVLHRGKLVYERYFNGMAPHSQHIMFSATKSFVGTLTLILAEQGRIDLDVSVAQYLPELKGSAFGDATVQQVLDMTTAIKYEEDYEDPASDIWRYGHVFRIWGTPPADYSGPASVYDYLPTLEKKGEHGEAFHYVTPNTDVLGWIISRVTGLSVSAALESMILQPIGAERDAYIWLDAAGTEMAGGGLNISARDAARFGQLILQKGRVGDRQVIPASVAARILQAGDPRPFNQYYKDPWYEQVAYAYHDQWWTFNNPHKAVSALGVHGQVIYIDPIAEVVIAKQSSDPSPESDVIDTDGPMGCHAIAEFLMKQRAEPAPAGDPTDDS
jgi:CubicO group peptidase (beta-lactamase class C family)